MKRLVITIFLPFLFAGTTGKTQKVNMLSNPADTVTIDTTMVKRIATRMATAWAQEKVKEIDSALAETIVGRIDEEHRPDGSAYAWIWLYTVIGRDTTYDTTIIKPVR